MANTKSKPVPPDHTERYRELVVGRIATPPPPKIERNTLDKVLDLFEGRWLGATAAAAVASAPTIRDLRPEDWLGALADLDTVIKTWASKYQDHAIEDPISITPPPIPENEKSPSRRNNVRGQAS